MGITAAILDQVAEIEGCDPLELPPLYDSIDADALERCVASADVPASFRFRYFSHTITVQGEGEVTVEVDGGDDTLDRDEGDHARDLDSAE